MQERLHAVLGENAAQRLAAAMHCSHRRFSHPRLGGVVLAVLELLEALDVAKVSLVDWPRSPRPNRRAGHELRATFESVLGGQHLDAQLAAILDLRPRTIDEAFKGAVTRSARDLGTVAELVELLVGVSGSAALPARWRDKTPMLRSPPPDGGDMLLRLQFVLGKTLASARFARAIEKPHDAMSRIWRGERDSKGRVARVQPSTVAIIELLETLRSEGVPLERWPARWREAEREPQIEPVSARSAENQPETV